MISRLTTAATAFAVLVAASMAIAASAGTATTPAVQAVKSANVVQLERVVVTGKRLAPAR